MGLLGSLASVAVGAAQVADTYNSTRRVLDGRGSVADGLSMVGQNSSAERVRAVQSGLQGDVGGAILHSLNADAFENR